ncbi:uncharacterized protein [Dermacentor albipictus]|uniref:uncharacterized protein n=1 Tax=Dermacentor albipictus TaxID=60249 RepID=UPI0031FDA590
MEDHARQEKRNQGKVMDCAAEDPSSSHFVHSVHFSRLCDWSFVYRARLNLLRLSVARPWARASDQRCRVGGYAEETHPHALCHCMSRSSAYTSRHNKIVDQVKTTPAKKFMVAHEKQPVGETTPHPVLALATGGEAIIIEVTCTLKNRLEALEAARQANVYKYKPIREYLVCRYQRVSIEAIVIGALDSWDPVNDRLLI